MHPLFIAAGFTAILILLTVFAVRNMHKKDIRLSESLAEEQRLKKLIAEAKKRYPRISTMAALSMYKLDNLELIRTLKTNDGKADVIEALKFSLRDQRIMEQEVARLFKAKVHRTSSFNKLTAAQI